MVAPAERAEGQYRSVRSVESALGVEEGRVGFRRIRVLWGEEGKERMKRTEDLGEANERSAFRSIRLV